MKYQELAKLFHMDTSSSRDSNNKKEYDRRKSMDSTFTLEVFSGSKEFFIAVPREMSVLMETILRAERKCSSMMRSIPPLGRSALIRGLVLDEVVSTNAIENINSTRKQIEEALEPKKCGDVEFKRFKEIAFLYLGLAKDIDIATIPKSLEDIRSIYDVIMDGELDDDKKPDGDLFRKSVVEITAGGIKVIHSGIESESKIADGLTSMIEFANRDDVPSLISASVAHFLFEFIHPFYDGNGRTGRYLLALFLSKTLSAATVLSLSRAISENKSMYYSAFSTAENPLNHGELTHFVFTMLELIRIAQSGTMVRLQESIDKFNSIAAGCEKFFQEHELSDKEKDIVFALAQYDLFGMVKSLTWDDIAESIGLSKQMTRKHIQALQDKKIIKTVSKRPLKVALSEESETSLGISNFHNKESNSFSQQSTL